jgi:hypothetical protein
VAFCNGYYVAGYYLISVTQLIHLNVSIQACQTNHICNVSHKACKRDVNTVQKYRCNQYLTANSRSINRAKILRVFIILTTDAINKAIVAFDYMSYEVETVYDGFKDKFETSYQKYLRIRTTDR